MIGSGSTTYAHFRDHYIYRYDLFGGDDEGALLHSNFNTEWTNSSGNAMQTPFQMFGRTFHLYSGPDPQMLSAHGHNAYESSLAPHPFRVNADGNACAILAGRRRLDPYGWDIRCYHVWVDYEGELHQLSQQRRHTIGRRRGNRVARAGDYAGDRDLGAPTTARPPGSTARMTVSRSRSCTSGARRRTATPRTPLPVPGTAKTSPPTSRRRRPVGSPPRRTRSRATGPAPGTTPRRLRRSSPARERLQPDVAFGMLTFTMRATAWCSGAASPTEDPTATT